MGRLGELRGRPPPGPYLDRAYLDPVGYPERRARAEYASQPLIRAILEDPELADRFPYDPIRHFGPDREAYSADCAADVLPTPALLTLDGRWVECGGPDYRREFNAYPDALDDGGQGAVPLVTTRRHPARVDGPSRGSKLMQARLIVSRAAAMLPAMADPTPVIDDLRAESDELDLLVAELSTEQWGLPTPAPGWTVAHQIAHLAWTDRSALLAVTDADAFQALVEKALTRPGSFVDEGAEEGARLPVAELLSTWRAGRTALDTALREAPAGGRFPWYGPPMSAASMATARLMETWAHALDVADALGVVRHPSDRLRHVARLGVRTRDFAFGVHGLTPPAEEFRVELTAPSGALWTYGPEGAPQRVTGPALDFCLLVTQRANRADLALHAEGPDADRWLGIAQAFAGPPGTGRPPKEDGR